MTGFISLRYMRYGVASLAALVCDVGLFVLFLHAGLTPALAAALGYGIGIAVHWLMSSRLVFPDCAAPPGPERLRQQGLFVGSALAGLALTTVIVSLGHLLGLLPIFAKLMAIVISFQVTWLLRRSIVFSGW
ncbi:GtrA family protein [Sphingobium lignivorans]|uniref:Flippase GtrA n=1 Tax=Sphingobium lignivorans TaxID=2735886 RepID=A0ABR6NA59_9SPHN|nr:GtrA family protein [Sphingobium lignivorans]MBB5984152.1 putative flippase GtrA [Sphingobium lignivorans]